MTAALDRVFMKRALALAERGWGRVQPNPMVGAVVVGDGAVIGEGWHAAWGGPHAEVEALRDAGPRAVGATLYVTLEPCAHHGKTPPCTDAIAAAGIRRVVFASRDPNPVAAGGREALEARGIAVESGVLASAARRLNAAFFHILEQEAPWVALKLAVSLDGRIARRAGERTSISGPEAAEWVHGLRAGFDGILVGAATAAVDDPLLTVRGATRPRVPPVRVVFDASGSLRPDSALARTVGEAPTWLVAGPAAAAGSAARLEALGIRVLGVPVSARGIDVRHAAFALWREGVRTILCEGGGRIGASLLAAGLIRRLFLVVAPVKLGRQGVPAFPEGLTGEWTVVETRPLGGDVLLVLEPADPAGGR